MLFLLISLLISCLTVFSLNTLIVWSRSDNNGIMGYVLATIYTSIVAGIALMGKAPLDQSTRLFLNRWIAISITAIYLIFWLVNECVIAPMMSA